MAHDLISDLALLGHVITQLVVHDRKVISHTMPNQSTGLFHAREFSYRC